MWRVVCLCGVASAAGCVSSGTWRSYAEVERALDVEERAAAHGAPSTCAELAQQLVDAAPSVRAGHARARAQLARARSEGALPAPELTLEVWDFPIGDPQLADREGMYMAGLEQEIPPAGSLDARARAAIEDANEATAETSEARRSLRARALEACIEWSGSALEVARHREAEALAAGMRDALLAQIRGAGETSLADVARIDAELARLRRMAIESEARERRSAARL